MMREYKRYDEYKGSGVKWIDEIPKEWNIERFRTLIKKIQNGKWGEEAQNDNNDVYCVRVADYNRNKNIVEDLEFTIRNLDKSSREELLLEENDLLIEKSGGGDKQPVGFVAQYKSNKPAIYANFMAKIEPRKKYVKTDYLKYVNISIYQKREILKVINQTTGIQNLDTKRYLEIESPLPPKKEQQIIASFLNQKTAKIDEIITKKEILIDYLEKYKKSVITEAVTKGKLGEKYINEDGELVDEIEMKDSKTQFYGNIPKHLIIKKMKYITKTIIDGAHLTPTYVDDGVPFLRVTDISDGNNIDWKKTKQIPLNEHKQLKARTNPEKGDLLVSKNGTIGKTRVITWDKEFSIFVSLCLLKFVKEVDPFYIAYFFKSYALDEQIKLSGKTNTITNLHLEKIRELELLIPEQDKLQKKIVNYLDQQTTRINDLIKKTKKSIEKYKEYKKSLIFEAVTGKIDLRDYELEGGEELAEHNNSSQTERECISAVD